MEIETLKAAWQDYDRLLQTTPELSKKALHRLIRERSRSRIAQIRIEYGVTCVFSFLLILFFGAVIGGNPFDFQYRIQFLPAILIMGWTLVFIIVLLRGYREVNISIHADNLILSLNKVISAYARSQALVHQAAVPVLLSGFFFPASFLPKHIYESGLTSGVLIAIAHIVLNVVLYFAAKRLGFFKSSFQAGLQRDLEELEQLKSLEGEENELE
ncbi:hypothetical protein DR864_29295 (plasmid) [Runella rosea]|uniref:DUF3278 domain-containing protein n=1 Tax=Runella rosea TaxID=2259595 RepID=A0A344TTJ0_9BACT|nr:hypothetical protein [Runella rosea]AXE21961.1 hypothetical protein DR864_29295 [Runella rosea]